MPTVQPDDPFHNQTLISYVQNAGFVTDPTRHYNRIIQLDFKCSSPASTLALLLLKTSVKSTVRFVWHLNADTHMFSIDSRPQNDIGLGSKNPIYDNNNDDDDNKTIIANHDNNKHHTNTHSDSMNNFNDTKIMT